MFSSTRADFAANYITLRGVRHILIPQEDGHWPPFAIVQASRTAPRDPKALERQRPILTTEDLFLPRAPTYATADGDVQRLVWCSRCDEWQRPTAFGPDKRKVNGLRSWCRTCENDYDRWRYRQRKAAA